MRFTAMAAITLAASLAAAPALAGVVVLDNFNTDDTAAGPNGLGDNWSMLKAGALIRNGEATGGTGAFYAWDGAGNTSGGLVEFDFAAHPTDPTVGSYYAGALLNWDGTSGYVFRVQHQMAADGFNRYTIGHITRNASTGAITYINGTYGTIGAVLANGHLSASVVNNVGTLTLTSGGETYSFNHTFAANQTFTGTGVGLNIHDGARIDNFAAAVPEPGAWALMISGFGLAGATLRRNRRLTLGSRLA